MSKELSPVDVRTGEVRLAFPALWVPRPRALGMEKPKLTFQATLLLPPSTDMKPFIAAIRAAMEKKWSKVIKLESRNNPLRDAGDKEYSGFEPGWQYISCHSDRQPGLVDRQARPVTDQELFFPGCWVRGFINAFAWDHKVGGKGVSFGLNALQFVRDDERLDGRRAATDVFESLGDLTGEAGAAKPAATSELDDLFG